VIVLSWQLKDQVEPSMIQQSWFRESGHQTSS